MKLMQFLMGLDDVYMKIKSSILSRETLPDIRSAGAIISSEESHMVASGSLSGTSQRSYNSAFNVDAPNRGNFQMSQTSTSFSRPSNESKPNDNMNRRTARGSGLDLRAEKILETDKQIGGLYYFDGNQDMPNNEERRNPSSNRHGDSPSSSCSPSASSKENDGGHFQDADGSASLLDLMFFQVISTTLLLIQKSNVELADLPVERKAIGSKWVLKIKYKSDGKIDRFKARLVAKVIRYLKGFPSKGINVIKGSASRIDLKAYLDAEWASTNEVNAVGSIVPAVGQNSFNSTNTFSAADMPELEDISYSDDEDVVGAEADFNNLESAIQEEPKKVHQALKDPSWIEAIQEELLQFKMQKV
nr:ribonuclease H-like domain-containing protein [Tanacetum cinerariifolium]